VKKGFSAWAEREAAGWVMGAGCSGFWGWEEGWSRHTLVTDADKVPP